MRQPFLYKGFQTGILRQVYLMSCCFSIRTENCSGLEPLYKNKRTDLEDRSVQKDTVFGLFEKGEIISNTEIKKVLYFKIKKKSATYVFSISKYFLNMIKNTYFDF